MARAATKAKTTGRRVAAMIYGAMMALRLGCQTDTFAAGLRRLEVLAARRPTAIMCAEAVPWRCHRSLIADALTVAKWRVLHIQNRTSAVPHQCTPFLVVRSARLFYPGRKGSF